MATGADESDWRILGQMSEASNATLLVEIDGSRFVYKPVRGERPLWDFPGGTLARREIAAYAVSERLGWDLVPPTTWVAEAPFGPGSLQAWVDAHRLAVAVFAPSEVPADWLPVIRAVDEADQPLEVAHRDSGQLRRMAAFDVLVNNADRKGSHVLELADGSVRGIDQGLCFHAEPKLRTVLWGFAGQPVPAEVLADIRAARDDLPDLLVGLSTVERDALVSRVEHLLASGLFPAARRGPAIPWPPL